jgi:hypothetical protein
MVAGAMFPASLVGEAVPAAAAANAALNAGATGLAGGLVRGEDVPATLKRAGTYAAGGAAIGTALSGLGAGVRLVKGLFNPGNVRTIDDILAAIPGAGEMPDAIAATNREAVRDAARKAYRMVIPEGQVADDVGPKVFDTAKKSARRAASIATKGLQTYGGTDPVAMNYVVQDALRQASLAPGPAKTGALKGIYQFYSTVLRDTGSTLRKDPMFGPVGAQIADLMERGNMAAALHEGEGEEFLFGLYKGLSDKERHNLTLASERLATPINDAVASRVTEWHNYAHSQYLQLAQKGVREQDVALTLRFNALPDAERNAVRGAFANPGDLTNVSDEAQKTLGAIKGADGRFRGDAIMVPLREKSSYVPHFINPALLKRLYLVGSDERNTALFKIIEQGQATNKKEASDVLDKILDKSQFFSPAEVRTPFQFSRELDLGLPYETDPKKWMPLYAHYNSRRLAQAAVFGGEDEVFQTLKGQLGQTAPGGAERLDKIWRAYIGRPKVDPALGSFSRAASNLATVAFLGPKTTLLQFMSLSNTAAAYGVRNTLVGVASALASPTTRAMVRESGATLAGMRHIFDVEGPDKWALGWVKTMGIEGTDRMTRIASAVAGLTKASQVAKRYAAYMTKGPLSAWERGRAGELERVITRLGLDPTALVEQGGKLTEEQARNALLMGGEKIQFASRAIDLPEFKSTNWGKWIYKFKTWSIQQAKFIDDYVIKEAQRPWPHGNLKPAARYLLALGVGTEASHSVLDLLAGRTPDGNRDNMQRVRDMLYAGALGAWGDMTNAMAGGDSGQAAKQIIGPGASSILEFGADVAKVASQDMTVPEFMLKRTPTAVQNTVKAIQNQ